MSTTPLSESAITEQLAKLKGWQRAENSITKTYTFDRYTAGLAFATAAGVIADGKNHHPDIVIGWKRVTLTFTTHDAGNAITQQDIDTAAAIDSVVE